MVQKRFWTTCLNTRIILTIIVDLNNSNNFTLALISQTHAREESGRQKEIKDRQEAKKMDHKVELVS